MSIRVVPDAEGILAGYVVAEGDPIDMIAQRLRTGSVFLINRKELPPTQPHLIRPGDLLLLTAKTG